MDSLSPNIFVNDMPQTIAFYNKLGFKVEMSVPEDGEFDWCMMSRGNVSFMFQTYKSLGEDLKQISRVKGGSLLLYFKMQDLDDFYEDVKEKMIILKEMETTFYGAKEFSVVDNNGYVLTFSEHPDRD